MSALSKILNALYGAYRLARFDADGMRYFDTSPAGFWHSFQAAILVLPLYLITIYVRWNHLDLQISGLQFFLIEMIAYVIAWVAYPVILPYVARFFDREKNYIRTVISYNWAAVLQNLLYSPIAILNLSNASGVGLLTFLVFLAILAYSWFIAKTALDVPPSTAWVIVALDIVISMFLSLWVDTLLSVG